MFRPLGSLLLVIFLCGTISAQESTRVKIETNKVLCLFSFLEVAKQDRSAPPSLIEFIQSNLASDTEFQKIVQDYSSIKLRYQMKREEYPESRNTYAGSKELIWIASSNAESIDDFSERIIGFLPNDSHQQLIDCMKRVEPFYDNTIWNKEKESIAAIETKLAAYKKEIGSLFKRISTFYGTEWKLDIPFKLMLYPIPAKQGGTTALPKGNTLICSFLAHNPEEYKNILGIAIHEMCHILYDAQSIEVQQNIETWFKESNSQFNNVAYSFIDEGLATALGNGWAYREIHNTLDTAQWYNNDYINGFAHAMFAEIDTYLKAGKTIDKEFIGTAINDFAKTFPNANSDINILMSAVEVFADFEHQNDAETCMNTIFQYFDSVRSLNFSVPITAPESLQNLANDKTKLIILSKNHADNVAFLRQHVKGIPEELDLESDWVYSFQKQNSATAVILINIQNRQDLGKVFEKLAMRPSLEYATFVSLK